MIKSIISRLTMVKTSQAGFWDGVSNEQVYFWQDYYFNRYMATSKWSYRIKIN